MKYTKRLLLVILTVLPVCASAQHGVEFEVGQSRLEPFYNGNATALQWIYDEVQRVQINPSATLESVELIGWTSPEGSYESNLELAQRRSEAVKDFVVYVLGIPFDRVTVKNGGEYWQLLDAMVEESDIEERDRILSIIRGTENPDTCESLLNKLPQPSRDQVQSLYADLRCVECQVYYVSDETTSVEGAVLMEVEEPVRPLLNSEPRPVERPAIPRVSVPEDGYMNRSVRAIVPSQRR